MTPVYLKAAHQAASGRFVGEALCGSALALLFFTCLIRRTGEIYGGSRRTVHAVFEEEICELETTERKLGKA